MTQRLEIHGAKIKYSSTIALNWVQQRKYNFQRRLKYNIIKIEDSKSGVWVRWKHWYLDYFLYLITN
jgi:hypothetical protein